VLRATYFIRWLFRSAFFSLLGGILMMKRLGGAAAAAARLRWFLTVLFVDYLDSERLAICLRYICGLEATG